MNVKCLVVVIGMTILTNLDSVQGQLDRRSGNIDFAEKTVEIPAKPPRSGYEPPGASLTRSLAESTTAAPKELLTHAEETRFDETGSYAEVISFARKLGTASGVIRVSSFGRTAQGRDLLLLIISKDRTFSPEAARKSGKQLS